MPTGLKHPIQVHVHVYNVHIQSVHMNMYITYYNSHIHVQN